jgi:hypothetical protein
MDRARLGVYFSSDIKAEIAIAHNARALTGLKGGYRSSIDAQRSDRGTGLLTVRTQSR